MSPATRNITSTKRKINPPSGDFSIIIPAAGMGHRMKSYGPKALIRLYQDVTLIERQIELLWSVYPNSEILIVVGFEAEKIRRKLSKYPVRFIFNPIHQNTNVLYSIGLAMQAVISEDVMVVYGDLIFNENAIRGLRGSSKVVIDNTGSLKKEEVGVVENKNVTTNFSFGIDLKWAQIAYLAGKEMQIFKEISLKKETSQWLGYEGLNYIIEKGGQIQAHYPKSMKIFEIDVAKDLEKIPKNKLKLS